MRIGLLVYALDRPLGGISRYAVELVRAMARLPDAPDITILTAGGPGPLANIGVEVVPLWGCSRLPALLTMGQAVIARTARQHRFDVIHDTTGIAPFLFGGGGARTVTTVHDVIPLSYSGVSTTLDSLIYRRWLPYSLPRVSQVVTVSECSRRDIARYLKVPRDRITAIPLAANPAFTPAPQADIDRVRRAYSLPDPYVLYLGSVEARKNIQRVFEAIAIMSAQDITVNLVVTGEMKWQYAGILDALDQHHIRDRVRFTGYIPEADLPALYTGARAFVFPSLYEGFGLPVLEAMACGTPVITSNTASLPEVAGDAALLVNPLDAQSLASGLERVIADDLLHDSLSAAGLERARQFSWDQTARQTQLIYQNVLAANGS
ncbi:MAG: glycosyltransferase family 1 protein [Anaerolineae bacterium]